MDAVFKSFCSFGDKSAAPLMDGSKFAKVSRDLKLLDKHLTSTDIDIIFSKVKSKSERKITFSQFQEALKQMADKKYAGAEDGLEKLNALILKGKGPAAHGTTKTTKAGAVDRLTDTSKYTGAHKERFADDGKGRGIVGREDIPSESGYVQGYKEQGSYDKKTG